MAEVKFESRPYQPNEGEPPQMAEFVSLKDVDGVKFEHRLATQADRERFAKEYAAFLGQKRPGA